MKLYRQEQALYDRLLGRGDVGFDVLSVHLGGTPERVNEVDNRGRWYAQSWVSRYIRRLNTRLAEHGMRVEPGEKRRTYRLVSQH